MRQALFEAVRARVAESGVEGLSLRTVTAAVGKSTTAVFQLFGSKEGLLRACMEDALTKDRAFHSDMLTSLEGVPLTAAVLADVIGFYILRRVDQSGRLWLEALYKSRQFPDLLDLTRAWHAERLQFWRSLLGKTAFSSLASFLPTYTAAEEGYATALFASPEYALLLRETITRLLDGCRGEHDADRPRGPLGEWVEKKAQLEPSVARQNIPAAMEKLLDSAVKHVEREGAAGLNLKRVAAEAEISPSQIVYHFGDFATFRNKVIFDALMRGVPEYLNSSRRAGPPSSSSRNWLEELERAVVPSRGGKVAGYYVTYWRILGQACLSAKRDRQLESLILYLRAIEGRGIHNASRTDWPAALRLGRDNAAGFAIWIKGHAILNEALQRSHSDQSADEGIATAASVLTLGSVP